VGPAFESRRGRSPHEPGYAAPFGDIAKALRLLGHRESDRRAWSGTTLRAFAETLIPSGHVDARANCCAPSLREPIARDLVARGEFGRIAEDQASDRAHRTGQQRPVTVYRLVAAGTIEERIVALHHHKRDLAASLLEGADGRISPEELLALLTEGGGERG